jgi:Urb2/Npa2 family
MMASRKRKLAVRASEIRRHRTASKNARLNPFLESGATFEEATLAHLGAFLEFAESKQQLAKDGEKVQQPQQESLQHLLEFLEGRSSSESNDRIERQLARTAAALLPWAVKSLLASAESEDPHYSLLWRSLASSLRTMVSLLNRSNTKDDLSIQTMVNNAFSTNVLSKLIPCATRVGHSGSSASEYAATCHRLLIRLNFVPSLEMALTCYLFVIVSNGTSTEQTPFDILQVIQVLAKALTKTNPKKAFQILTTEENMLELARVYVCLKDNVKPGNDEDSENQQCLDAFLDHIVGSLFDVQHLDGFKWLAKVRGIPSVNGNNVHDKNSSKEGDAATTAASKMQCYQENLLKSMENLVLDTSSSNVLLSIRFLPVILQVLFRKVSEIEAKSRQSNDTLDVGKDLGPLLLYFFAHVSTSLLRSFTLAEPTATAKLCSLRSLDQCLKHWSRHDTLAAMDPQKGAERLRCLEAITTTVLESSRSTKEALELAATILERLVRLDHTLIANKVETFIDFIASPRIHRERDAPASSEAALVLMTTVLETYAQLRQAHRILVALLRVASALHSKNDGDSRLKRLDSILTHASVKRALAKVFSGSPVVETRKMFETLNIWIVTVASSKAQTDGVQTLLSIGVTHLATGLLSAVKVNESTAPVIAHCCEKLVNTSAKELCDDVCSDQEAWRTRLGITLCRFVTQLQMQCAFWLGHQYSQACELEWSMTCRVNELPFATDTTNAGENAIDDLLCIACFRLRRLDFLIGNRIVGKDDSLPLYWQYEQEARQLTLLAAHWADRLKGAKCGWRHVAQGFASWVRYASEESQQRFLTWMFSALADVGVSLEDSGERSLVLSIISDASFFELGDIALPVTSSGLATVALLIEDATESMAKNDRARTETAGIRQVVGTSDIGWTASSPKDIARLLLQRTTCSVSREREPTGTVCSLIRRAMHVAEAVNKLQAEKLPSMPLRNAMAALQLEQFCRPLCGKDKALMGTALDLASVLRSIAAKEFASAGQEGFDLLVAIPNGIDNLLRDILELSVDTLECYSEPNCQRFIFATADLVMSIGECYLKHECREAFWEGVNRFVTLSFVIKENPSDAEKIVLCTLARSLVSSVASFDKELRSDLVAVETFLVCLIDWVATLPACCIMDSDALRDEVYLMASVIFLFASRMGPEQMAFTTAMRSLAASLFPTIVPSRGRKRSNAEPPMYMMACYAVTNPPLKQSQWLLSYLIRGDLERDWLKASIVSLMRELDADSLCYAMSTVIESVSNGHFHALQLFPLLFRNLERNEHVEILSSFTPTVHRKCLAAFGRDDADSDGASKRVADASSVMISLVQEKRQQAEINERDIAQIFAQVSKVVGSEYPPNGVLGPCLRLLAALVQHLPQRVFSCAPSLMTALQALLKYLLFGELDEPTIKSACNDFARLFELLSTQKDVIKKHILCLVLEYLHYLEQESSSVFRKECFTPSFMHILGMLSKHEIEQLTTMMNPTMKTLFRPFHQSFQKLYAHQG